MVVNNSIKEQSLNKLLKHLEDTWTKIEFIEESCVHDNDIKFLTISDEITQILQNDQV
jgi:hypothetical protein